MSSPAASIALYGFGRFGRSLAELLEASGLTVRAYDPAAEIPDRLRVDDPQALAGLAETIIFAVPVPAFAAAVERVRPRLGPDHLVLEVASVKHGPVATLTRVLGRDVPWVATHPLFGPSSLAVGQRPLRVVVCPNALHPEATQRARALFERLGCVVVEHDSDEHDRQMAQTHALAFFIAKGLLDIGLDREQAFVPPSFRAIARTLAAVRSDAGHLFLTIERDNPHASGERARLLAALERIHHELAVGSQCAPPESVKVDAERPNDTAMQIPDLGRRAPEQRAVGELLAECDAELLRVLARRSHLAHRLEHDTPSVSPAPDRDTLQRAWREELGLSPDDLDRAVELLGRLRD